MWPNNYHISILLLLWTLQANEKKNFTKPGIPIHLPPKMQSIKDSSTKNEVLHKTNMEASLISHGSSGVVSMENESPWLT